MTVTDSILQKMVFISQTEIEEPSHILLNQDSLERLLVEQVELAQLQGETFSNASVRDLEDFFGATITITNKPLVEGFSLLKEV